MGSKVNKRIRSWEQSKLREYRTRISEMEQELQDSRSVEYGTAEMSGSPSIFRSEYDYISSCILDYPNIETGGQLFGYWTTGGNPVVVYAIGPGRNANHQRAFFNQDIDYLVQVGRELHSRFGLRHIGEWHSHHQLGLASPSRHDANTMISTIREKNLGRFLLCIGNYDKGMSTFNPFMCDDKSCRPACWDVIEGESPVRGPADVQLGAMLIHPLSAPSYRGQVKEGVLESPGYPEGYFLTQEWGREEFKSYIEYINKKYIWQVQRVSPKVDAAGLAHLVIHAQDRGRRITEDIVFPAEYPAEGPVAMMTIDGRPVRLKDAPWDRCAKTFAAFKKFYEKTEPVK